MPKYSLASATLLGLNLIASLACVTPFEGRRAALHPVSLPSATSGRAETLSPPSPVPTDSVQRFPANWGSRTTPDISAPVRGADRSRLQTIAATRVRAYRRWQAMTVGFTARGSVAPTWTSIGPQSESNVDIGGPVRYVCSGRITAIALVPGSETIYIGAAGGGVWRLDPGQPWKPLTDSQASLSIGALAVDPSNPNTIYAATGEQNNSGDEYLGVGILKSTDGGSTWSLLGSSVFTNHTIGAIAVSPSDPNVVIVGSRLGVLRSTDAGVTWTGVLPAGDTTADSVVFDPSNEGVVYASIGGTSQSSQAGVYMSTDSGVTWKSISGSGTSGLPVASAGRITLTVGPPSSPGLYAGVSQYSNPTQSTPDNPVDDQPFIGLYQLVEGSSWRLLASASNAYCAPAGDRSQCDYNNVVAIQPTSGGTPGIMLGGGIDLRMSSDGGVNWTEVTAPDSMALAVHSDQHAIVFSPDGSTVYVGNDGGVWSASISGTNFSWTNLNSTLTLAQFYPGLSIHPTNPNISYGGTQDNNVLAYSGPATQWSSVTGEDGAATAIDPVTPTNVYASVGATDITTPIYKSTDGTNFYTSDPVTNNSYSTGIDTDELPFPPFLAIDPNNPSTLYFTGKTQVYQSTNAAASWMPIPGDLTLNAIDPTFRATDQLCHIAVAPTNSNNIYAASCYGVVSAATLSSPSPQWITISAGLPQNMMSYRMTHVIPDSKTAGLVYVTTSQPDTGRIFSTQNDGQTWTDLTNNLPNVEVTDLVVDPDISNTLYVATTMGVYWSNNGGQVWSVLGAGLPNSPVTSLLLHRASRTLRAATHGRGVWDLPIPIVGNLIPLVQSVSPSQIESNSSDTLTVTGQNFTAASVILCNGSGLPTTYVSATQLAAPVASCLTSPTSLLNIAIFTPGPGGGQSPEYFVNVGTSPVIYPAGIVNGASFSGYTLAPGGIASMFGGNFNSSSGPAQLSVPLPSGVNGTAVSLSDSSTSQPEPLAIFYVSPGQINFQVPWDAPTSGEASFTVSNNLVTSPATSKSLATFAPGIFILSSGVPAITLANTLTLPQPVSQASTGFATTPAKPGDALSIYCTGLGAVTNTPAYGAIAPGPPNLATTTTTPTVFIGGQLAKVLYSGLAPGYVGLYQINVVVPSRVAAGSSVSLLITDGVDVRSNTVFIAVQ